MVRLFESDGFWFLLVPNELEVAETCDGCGRKFKSGYTVWLTSDTRPLECTGIAGCRIDCCLNSISAGGYSSDVPEP
jgi:hypothetical protein